MSIWILTMDFHFAAVFVHFAFIATFSWLYVGCFHIWRTFGYNKLNLITFHFSIDCK